MSVNVDSRTADGRFTSQQNFDPRDMSYANETKIIEWIHNWGFSTQRILTSLQGLTRSRTLQTIEKQGKILREPTYLTFPRFVYKLSEFGVSIAEARLEKPIRYAELNNKKVATSLFMRDLYAQSLTLSAGLLGVCRDYATSRTILAGGELPEKTKTPNAIWICSEPQHSTIALEVVMNQEFDKGLDNFFGRIIESIESGEVAQCLIVTQSRATHRNYTQALKAKSFTIWKKGTVGVLQFDREVELRSIVAERIHVVFSPEIDMHKTIRNLTVNGELKRWLQERIPNSQRQLSPI